jgi:prepilin-type N-terminal cleavage/methylation domain-containing protein
MSPAPLLAHEPGSAWNVEVEVLMSRRPRGFTLIEITIAVLVVGILAAIALPNYMRARANSRIASCLSNLKRIEDAKEMWAAENRAGATATPTKAQLLGDATTGFMRSWPSCPENGTYAINDMTTRPTCTVAGHVFP